MLTNRTLGSLAAAAILAIAPLAHAADDITRKTESAIEKSEDRLEDGDRAKAVEAIDDRLDDKGLSDLDKAALYMARAKVHAGGEGGDLAAAELDLRAAMALADVPSWQRDEVVTALAELYLHQGKAEEALALLQDYSNSYGASTDMMAMIRELEISTGAVIPTALADRPMAPVSTSAPRFPAQCPRNAAEYKVSVLFDVTATGETVNIRVVSSTNPCLEPAAIAAVSQWTFDPAVQSGYFVQTRDVPVTVTFS